MYRDIATTLYKRGEASMDGYEMPQWAWAIFALNILVFLPPFLIVSYTFQHVYPTLAIVEDPSPPAYDPVSLNEDGQPLIDERLATGDAAAVSRAPLVTSSLRSTNRAVYAVAGWRSLFRGYGAYVFLSLATGGLTSILIALRVPAIIARVIAPLALVQPYATWTHIIISAPSSKSFWQRFPPFKRAFKATAVPILLHSLASALSAMLPMCLASLLRMNTWKMDTPNTLPQPDKDDAWKGVLVLFTSLALQVLLVIPTLVALIRVQASFLPEEYDTIVPFDRSFGGKVEPAVLDGKGYVNALEALKRFSRASWIRLIKLYVKIFWITSALTFIFVAVLIPEYILIANHSRKVGEL